jgi:hypothetical protein
MRGLPSLIEESLIDGERFIFGIVRGLPSFINCEGFTLIYKL